MSTQETYLCAPGVSLRSSELIGLRACIAQMRRRNSALSPLSGGFVLRRRGKGQDIADSRVYAPGDDLRHIDQGATARTGTLHIRTFHEERDRVSLLVADFRPSMLWGVRRAFRSVAAAQALTLTGWRAVESGGKVALMAITGHETHVVRPRARARGMLNVIGAMVRAHKNALAFATDRARHPGGRAHPGPDLDRALAGLKNIAPNGSRITIASGLDAQGSALEDLVGELAQHRHLRFIVLQERAIDALPAGTYPIRTPDGRRFRARVSARAGTPKTTPGEWMPRRARYIDPGAPLEALIRQLEL